MVKVKMVLVGGEFRAEKLFDWSYCPVEGTEEFISLGQDGGYACARIKRVKHYAEEDAYEATCIDALDALCRLYVHESIDDKMDEVNGKWKMENFAEFELNSEVGGALAKINVVRQKLV